MFCLNLSLKYKIKSLITPTLVLIIFVSCDGKTTDCTVQQILILRTAGGGGRAVSGSMWF